MLEIIEHGEIREIKLAHPPANAIGLDLTVKLTEALEQAGEQSSAVVVSGLPGMFSAGLDVPSMMKLDRSELSMCWQAYLKLLKTIAHMPVPTVFAMTGHAPAGGIVMALFGDYRIMPEGSYKTGLNEVQVGLVVSSPIHLALVRAVGPKTAEHMLVSGAMVGPDKALEIGLVDELAASPDEVVSRALEWCRQHTALPRNALNVTRQMARADLHAHFDDKSELGVEKFVEIWFSDETQSTLTRLVERLSAPRKQS